ncbi:MAG: zinc-dependent metalloprotease [Flavobacteriales bacterium]|nr:zinc-dependent metalloprotease [Flavobacteriales bacterium]
MKRLTLLAFVIFSIDIYSQTICGTPERLNATTNIELNEKEQLKALRSHIKTHHKTTHPPLLIPTVVHIVSYLGIGDISDAQVYDGIRILNEDFDKKNQDTANIRQEFAPYLGDANIQFVLAKIDPDGNPTNGIVRLDTNLVPHAEPGYGDFDNVKYASYWPSDKYYNIWVVRNILPGGVNGYAQYPGTDFTYGGPWNTYGSVVRYNHFGSIELAGASDGRTVTHEVGHTFGLYHTFLSAANDCGGDCDTSLDEVCDTPPAFLSFNCNPIVNTCSNDSIGPSPFATDMPDQIENFMGYNSCTSMFTKEQVDRMRGFISFFPTLSGLSSNQNLIETGIIPASITSISSPTDFIVYPNPSNGIIFIQNNTNEQMDFEVLDLTGKLVANLMIQPGRQSLNLQNGVYFIKEKFTQRTSRIIVVQSTD